jgi:26S proteasome regulatory subunit N3
MGPDKVIKQNLQLLEKAVATLDPRFTYRVLKMSNLRKRLSAEVLVQAVQEVYPQDHPSVPELLNLLDKVRHATHC